MLSKNIHALELLSLSLIFEVNVSVLFLYNILLHYVKANHSIRYYSHYVNGYNC